MSRSVRIPRGRRGTIATVVALLAVLVLAFGALEAIAYALNDRTIWFDVDDLARFARHTQLTETVVLVVAIVVFAVGVLLLVAALLPAKRRLIELDEPDPTMAAGLTKRSFRRTLAAAAVEVDGVSEATVKGRRRLRVKARTALRDAGPLPDRVQQQVTERLEQLRPIPARTVRVRLDRKDD